MTITDRDIGKTVLVRKMFIASNGDEKLLWENNGSTVLALTPSSMVIILDGESNKRVAVPQHLCRVLEPRPK